MTALDLTGLRARPAQVYGAIRLVPLVRDRPITDLRLHARAFDDAYVPVDLGDRTVYTGYIPHAYIAEWTDGDGPSAAYGSQLVRTAGRGARSTGAPERVRVPSVHRRPARGEDRNRARFLPLHLALEGYLALHFRGPSTVWEEWSETAVRRGLSPRTESAVAGSAVDGLDDALRLFEIVPGQCGMFLYAGDALAAAFAVPHPEDYRALHASLVQDLFGETVHQFALYQRGGVPEFRAAIDPATIATTADLRAAAARRRSEWEEFHRTAMADGLLGERYAFERVRRLGAYTLSRFRPPFARGREQHIGEVITDHRGRAAYLKTFRLSEAQIGRGYLLHLLAHHDWSVPAAAAALGLRPGAMADRITRAGFGRLLRQDVADRWRKEDREAAEQAAARQAMREAARAANHPPPDGS